MHSDDRTLIPRWFSHAPFDPLGLSRLCNPPLNPLSHSVREGIIESLAQARADDGVTCLVITGGDHAFSAGADIKEMEDGAAVSREPTLVTVVDAIEACEVPVVAAISGVALGGGCEVCPLCVSCETICAIISATSTILYWYVHLRTRCIIFSPLLLLGLRLCKHPADSGVDGSSPIAAFSMS